MISVHFMFWERFATISGGLMKVVWLINGGSMYKIRHDCSVIIQGMVEFA